MHRKANNYLVLFAVVALVSLAAGIVSAAPVTRSITYQGKLTDAAGNPLAGTYSVRFSLYEAATGGTAIASSTQSVTCSGGLFTTPIAFSQEYFDGRALWLGVKAGSDPEMTPRQEVRPVPYALGLRPGAVISGDATTNPSLKVINTGSNVGNLLAGTTGENAPAVVAMAQGAKSPAVYGISQYDVGIFSQGKEGGYFTTTSAGTYGNYRAGVNSSTFFSYNPGVFVTTQGDNSDGVKVRTKSDQSTGLDAGTEGDWSDGMYARTEGNWADGVDVTTYGEGSHGVSAHTYGPNSAALRGESAQDVGVYGEGKEGAYFTTNQAGTSWPGNPAVNVSTLYQYNPGILIQTAGTHSDGMHVETKYSESDGVSIVTRQDVSDGVKIQTRGYESEGVYAVTYGEGSAGLDAWTEGDWSDGVNALTLGDHSDGVNARTNGNYSYGMKVSTMGHGSDGVSAVTYGANSQGLYATTYGDGSEGVYADSYNGIGVVGEGHVDAGVKGVSSNKAGVWGFSWFDVGVYAETNRADNKYGVYTPDYIYAKGGQFPTADVAEYMPVVGNVTPGTVLVVSDTGQLKPSATAYDTRVAGIVSTDPGISLGTKDDGNLGEALIAVAGRVPCKVDASYGAIHPGDLLTSSETPGHAMKAANLQIGTILGKAMGTLESGTGTIEVLVTLQ